eukprot:scaffold33489_cov69-Phaeocystis_antarctica.AAC.1
MREEVGARVRLVRIRLRVRVGVRVGVRVRVRVRVGARVGARVRVRVSCLVAEALHVALGVGQALEHVAAVAPGWGAALQLAVAQPGLGHA